MSEATRFSNDRLRPAANILVKLYRAATVIPEEWNARPEVQLPDTDDPIDDGSGDSGDGRPQGTGKKARRVVTLLDAFKTWLDNRPGAKEALLSFSTHRAGIE